MQFGYQVKTREGQLLEGTVEAPTENAAVELLQEKGYLLLSLREERKDIFSGDLNQYFIKVKSKDIVMFTRQLSTLIDADMPLAEGLHTLSKQVDKPIFKKIISAIADAVEGGSSLSAALALYPNLFSSFYVKLVKSGELSGKLHESLNYLADYLERSQGITSKIKGALAYPLFVLSAMIVVTGIMMIFVLPQLLQIFEDAGVTELPLTTRILIGATNLFNAYLWYLLFIVIVAVIVFVHYIRSAQGKIWLDDAKIRVPVFGQILKNLYLARIAETLATLIRSDIAILDALRVTADLVGNRTYQMIILDAEENVRGGGSISDILAKYPEVPALLTSMIAIGERTGRMEFMLGHVSKFYRAESENSIAAISQLIEPVLVLILGIGVAILVSSILLPMYSLVNAG